VAVKAVILGTTIVVAALGGPAPSPPAILGTSADLHAGLADDRLCSSCHWFEPSFSHPVGITPSMAVPEQLPLRTGGEMTCTTCHVPQAPARLQGGETIGAAAPGTHGLCRACHGTEGGDLHALATRAHLPHGSTAAKTDTESATCLGCHDGAVAASMTSTSSAGPPTAAGLLSAQHPIGALQRPRGSGDSLRAASELAADVRLFDGRIGCGSCHSPYSTHPNQLVMSNERSRLCLECHDY
jgi:predicted CXXCH cytochrome family protein